MSNRFDSALRSREENRLKLAAVLDEKYSEERRKKNIVRGTIAGLALLLVVGGMRGGQSLFGNLGSDVAKVNQKQALSSKKIIEEMQEQVANNESMMIGGSESNAPTIVKRKRRENPGYAHGEPAPLAQELREKKKFGKQKDPGAFNEATVLRRRELDEIDIRTGPRRKKFDYGNYRPSTVTEIGNHPLPRRARSPIPRPDLYSKLLEPPRQVVKDLRLDVDEN